MGVKTSKSSSRSLDRSVSAPTLGSPERSPAETLCPRGARSAQSLPEGPATLGREDLPLTSLNLSDRDAFTHVDASLAGTEQSCSPSSPSLNTRAKPAPSGSPKPSCAEGSGPGLASSVEEAEGSCLPRACTQAGEGPVLPSSHLELSHTGPKPPEELGMEQPADPQLQATRAPEDVSAPTAPPCPPSDHSLPEGSDAKDSELTFPSEGDLRRDPTPHKPPGNETLMEVEGTDPALIAAGDWPKEQNANVSAESSECSVMETESPQSSSSLAMGPFSASDWKQSGRRTFDSTETSVPTGFSGSPPPPPPPEGQLSCQVEEAHPSLASALKELHQLLVVSYKKTSGNEGVSHPGTLPGDRIADERIFEGKPQECHERDSQDMELASSAGIPECVQNDVAAGLQCPGAGAEDGQLTLEPSDKGASIIKEPLDLDSNSLIVPKPSVASDEPPGGKCSEMLPLCLSSDQTAGSEALEQNPPPPSLTQGSESQSVLNPPRREPGMPVSSGALPTCSQEADPAVPQPLVIPATNIDQIVRAGFTAQEACEALARAGGEVDLALLILLAKKIVVPT